MYLLPQVALSLSLYMCARAKGLTNSKKREVLIPRLRENMPQHGVTYYVHSL